MCYTHGEKDIFTLCVWRKERERMIYIFSDCEREREIDSEWEVKDPHPCWWLSWDCPSSAPPPPASSLSPSRPQASSAAWRLCWNPWPLRLCFAQLLLPRPLRLLLVGTTLYLVAKTTSRWTTSSCRRRWVGERCWRTGRRCGAPRSLAHPACQTCWCTLISTRACSIENRENKWEFYLNPNHREKNWIRIQRVDSSDPYPGVNTGSSSGSFGKSQLLLKSDPEWRGAEKKSSFFWWPVRGLNLFLFPINNNTYLTLTIKRSCLIMLPVGKVVVF